MSGASLLLRFKPCSVYAHPLGVSQNDENGKVDDNNSIVHIQTYSVVVYCTKNPRRIASGCTEHPNPDFLGIIYPDFSRDP